MARTLQKSRHRRLGSIRQTQRCPERWFATPGNDLGSYRTFTFSACRPLGPLVTLNSTAWPSGKLRKPLDWMAEKCTNTSPSPLFRVINPNPFASLNHFTIPCSICSCSFVFLIFLLKKIDWYL